MCFISCNARYLVPLALVCLLLTGCGRIGAESPVPQVSSEVIRQVAKGEQQFAFDLYAKMIASTDGENVFFSPHSVYSVLAMVAEGADGETAEQMAKVLGLEKQEGASQFANTHQGLAALAAELKGSAPESKDRHILLTANALWVDKSFPLAPSYQQALGPYLASGGGVFACDFRNQYPAEAKRIDQWCSDNTRARITNIMPNLGAREAELLKLVLTNAVYFEGKWFEPFDPKNTRPQKFRLADGEAIETAMMNARNYSAGRYGAVAADGTWFETPATYDTRQPVEEQGLYPEGEGFTMVELPYQGDRLSMLLIAPRGHEGLPHIERLITAERLAGWVEKMKPRQLARLQMPKLDLATDYDMTQNLAGLGMERAFTPGGADFSRMVAASDSSQQVYLSMVLHKATLEVDEQGTIAAAVTAGLVEATAAPIQSTRPFRPEFLADRPFLLLIRDRQTGDILFMGRINDPR